MVVVYSETLKVSLNKNRVYCCEYKRKDKGKPIPLQAWTGPECSRRLRLTGFKTIGNEGVRLSALRTGRLYPPGIIPGTHFS
jgi:hypothetical protein